MALILAIETSCDDTSAAVVDTSYQVLSNVVSSQEKTHSIYGGVVPEIASRLHYEAIDTIVTRALEQSHIALDTIDAIACTRCPGLLGSLLVGVNFAKGLAWQTRKPLIGIHHIEGHLLAPLLEHTLEFPFVCCVMSGGHTSIYRADGFGDYHLLARTIDDAAGEAFDKVSKMMGFAYPGGPVIDKLAQQGEPTIRFTIPRIKNNPVDFSFSGMKTAVLNHIQQNPDYEPANVAASFQHTIARYIVERVMELCQREGINRLAFSGGVSVNSTIRALAREQGEKHHIHTFFPSPRYCTDNAAMIGAAAVYRYARSDFTPLDEMKPLANSVL
ncbi:tRNA (adenosine(37)-N6)-threonylcarbamoyltransferase complex transferase subunit TsaD [Desulfurispirillum indicum]|uniref:tRNA (adenosine(37)-N6)-threonylcarbamoyltransferase complex transferase subunit TsaD n=1 Tax=Desulfurispirillum indicum TaxID=936456 RepID=UPI001CFA5FE2|nr:tRNA (adenosine(37)-N6)-threonylcarbamoyltransferase complex transferase subunit TsaD [Desulfurispirillum indicum]UCZ55813.1 tRNA (adenosine(37)-N6)-threonylcarbamoyltransferase complex transferase subunit TsaD [Desulfurispirillum indicum]